MLYARACVVVMTACSFTAGRPGQQSDAAAPRDALVLDGAVDTPAEATVDARTCFGTFINICLTAAPPASYAVTVETTINTDMGCPQIVTQTTGPALCVIAAAQIQIDALLHASGSRALVLIATETMTIGAAGLVDVGSWRRGGTMELIGAGAASGAALCGSPSGGQSESLAGSGGAGGGAGGSFGGRGGFGADGRDGSGGNGGSSSVATGTPTFLRGGCRGTNGGSGEGNAPGSGAYGGGAALLIAGTSINNAGHVRACGMGGYGGSPHSGGGGGGSGGMIVLDAPTIANSGIVNANGGGGGEGGGTSGGGATAPSATAGTSASIADDFNINGGNGGAGSFGATLAGGSGGSDAYGGGAGGGGAGVVRVFPAQTLAGTVSPPAT